jgi:hypothetical protein
MKLGSGLKVKMHQTPRCKERDPLASECTRLLGEWLAWKDEVKITKKNDRAYARKVEQMKEAHRKLKAASKHLTQHALYDHGCW